MSDGRQVYVVCPLVEESEALDLQAATEMAERLQGEVFTDLTIGLLHGRMRFAEKDRVMREFKAGAIHVLVSTTVIEVGIDVPNASVMLDRARGAVRPLPAPPASRARRPRPVEELLHPALRRARRTTPSGASRR